MMEEPETEDEQTDYTVDPDGGETLIDTRRLHPLVTARHDPSNRELCGVQYIRWHKGRTEVEEHDHILTLEEAEDKGLCVNAFFFASFNQWTLKDLGTDGSITWYGSDRDQLLEVEPDGDGEWIVTRTELVDDPDYHSPVRKTTEVVRLSDDDVEGIEDSYPYAVGCALDHMSEFNPYAKWRDARFTPCGEDYAPWIREDFLDANERAVSILERDAKYKRYDDKGHIIQTLEFVDTGDDAPTLSRVFLHHDEETVDHPSTIFQYLAGHIGAAVDTGYYEKIE